jgi:branched-chain amino acid transport system substrate-binding protein
MGPVLNRAKIPFITTLSSNSAITESRWEYVNRLHLSDRTQVERIVQYAVETDHFTKLGILYDTSDLGVGGRNIALAALEKRSVKPLVVEGWKQTDADFSSQVIKLKEAQVEGVIIWGSVEGAVRIAQQMRALGLEKIQIYGGGGLVSQKYIDLGGAAVDGTIATWAYLDTSQPFVAALRDKYEARFKSKIDIFGAQGYDALRIFAQAMATAGTDSKDRPKIEQAVRAIHYTGAVGDVTFDANGENVRKVYVAQLRNGKFSVVK